jgi:hypothetical protein
MLCSCSAQASSGSPSHSSGTYSLLTLNPYVTQFQIQKEIVYQRRFHLIVIRDDVTKTLILEKPHVKDHAAFQHLFQS